jgi:hypothetical protein
MAIISNAVTIADAGAFSVSLGSMVHIKTLTASSSATLSFVHGTDGVVLDSTYPIYKFEFINIHPSGTNNVNFNSNFTDSGSNYNVTKTTTSFGAYHAEDDSYAALRYDAPLDLAQGTGFQTLFETGTPNNEESSAGTLTLFNPSSSVFVKHFISDCTNAYEYTVRNLIAGYGNTTNSVDAIQFKMESGNIDDGKIKLYGIKDS